jgi:hypothetical protein
MYCGERYWKPDYGSGNAGEVSSEADGSGGKVLENSFSLTDTNKVGASSRLV